MRIAEETKVNKSEYRSLAHVCPTSVMVERFFSDANKHIMMDDRHHMDPSTLDMLLVLKHNKDLSKTQTIDHILNKEEQNNLPATIGSKRPHSDDEDDGEESVGNDGDD